MKQFLAPHLICPACLPDEIPLVLTVKQLVADDIVSGELCCRGCKRRFAITDGIALLLRDARGGQQRYEEREMLNRYLWSHYADLAGCDEVGEAATAWAGCLSAGAQGAFDAGCAVGRLTFEMAARSQWAVGCDLSLSFIRAARRLARERRISFSLPLEGQLRESFQCELPAHWRNDNLEFVVADALALPFARGSFQQVASMNLLDRVSYPLAHLYEMNRVAQTAGASFLFADPFSWSADATPEERWLGGTALGPYPGRGIDNVHRLLTGAERILTPPWRIVRQGAVCWPLRSHANHRELINSLLLLAER